MFDAGSRTQALAWVVLLTSAIAGFGYVVLVVSEYVRAASVRTFEELRRREREKRLARLAAMGYKPREIENLERLGAAELARRIKATVNSPDAS